MIALLLLVLMADPSPSKKKPAPCVLQLEIQQKRTAKKIELEVVVTNVSKKEQSFALANRCPTPPIDLKGLPDNVDAFQLCRRAPCMSQDVPLEMALGPGQSTTLASATFRRLGGDCGAPLVGGPHQVTAEMPFMGGALSVCPMKPVEVMGFEPADAGTK